jgi:hypothetical protein
MSFLSQGVRTLREEEKDAGMRSLRGNIKWPYESATKQLKILVSKYNKRL